MKNKNAISVLIIISIIGFSFVLLLSVSRYATYRNQVRAIEKYIKCVEELTLDQREKCVFEAHVYNDDLDDRARMYHLDEQHAEKYTDMLGIPGSDVMGYIEIPKIACSFPIYRGTDNDVLAAAARHVEWSSLPVGGESSHCVISGHRGLADSAFISDIEQMDVGDIFLVCVLDMNLTYKVDQKLIVEPNDVSNLTIEKGKDYCSLSACKPYGLNPHRTLIRGHRVENSDDVNSDRMKMDSVQAEPRRVVPVIVLPILILLLVLSFIKVRKAGERKD